MSKLDAKVIVVVGAAGLIGKVICRSIIDEGGRLVAVDVNRDSLEKLREMEGLQNESFEVADINSEESIANLIQIVKIKFGKIDAVINTSYPRNKNFGKDFYDVKLSDFCENLSLHLGGYFNVNQKFASYFSAQGFGSIVNLSSIYGIIAPRFEIYQGTSMTNGPEYAAIKSALIFLTKFIAQKLKGSSVRINSISPGGILDQQPESFLEKYKKYCNSKGMLNPDDLIGAVHFLVSDDSKFVTGQNIVVDDGFSL